MIKFLLYIILFLILRYIYDTRFIPEYRDYSLVVFGMICTVIADLVVAGIYKIHKEVGGD